MNIKIINKIIEINKYKINKGMNILDSVYLTYAKDLAGLRKKYDHKMLLGLWRFYILENYNKLQYQRDHNLSDNIKSYGGFKIVFSNEKIEKPQKWEDMDYYYCLLSIDHSFYNPVIIENFKKWLNELSKRKALLRYWNTDDLVDLNTLSDHGNRIIEIFKNLDINTFDKSYHDLIKEKKKYERKEKIMMKKHYNLNEKNKKLESKLNKILPEDKKTENLVKYFINIALKIKKMPSYRQLAYEGFNASSWHAKMNDVYFMSFLFNSIEKKLNRLKKSSTVKDTLIFIKNECLIRLENISPKKDKKAGLTSAKKPDYDDDISKEIQDEFNHLN